MRSKTLLGPLLTVFWLLLLVACTQTGPTPLASPGIDDSVSTLSPTASMTPHFTDRLEATQAPTDSLNPDTAQMSARVIPYDLGDTTLLQAHFPEDSRFHNMPVHLLGVIGVPAGEGPHPVVLILHGSHHACPGENVWPCTAQEEQPNYAGFTYLVEALANAGYVGLSIDVNAEYTFGFGEAPPSTRTIQLIDTHLNELAAANNGDADKFSLDLKNRIDLSRMVWIGHSRGGDLVNWIVRQQNLATEASPAGYGPVQGLILLAPSVFSSDALPTVDLPMAVILPTCDSDVVNLNGQLYYESARFDPDRAQLLTSVFLEGGNHNNFNTVLQPDFSLKDRPDCNEGAILTPQAQQDFLVQYTLDYLHWLYSDPIKSRETTQRLGLDAASPPPTRQYDLPVQVTTLFPTTNHLTVIQPQSKAELNTNLLGGEVEMTGTTAAFCPEGNYVPATEPGTEPCKRVNFNQPGYPQQFVLSWETPDAQLHTSLPESMRDLTGYTSLQLRAALDPLSELNPEGESQSFTVAITDVNGVQGQIVLNLPYPSGERLPNEHFEGGFFSGQVFMNTLLIPLNNFNGVDLTNITEIALLFDQHETGTLFIADLGLNR